MNKFVVSRILANGDLVVRPAWVWGGCKGTRVRAMSSVTRGLKAGLEIELRDGVSVVDECLICDVRWPQGTKTNDSCSDRQPFGAGGNYYATMCVEEECSCI